MVIVIFLKHYHPQSLAPTISFFSIIFLSNHLHAQAQDTTTTTTTKGNTSRNLDPTYTAIAVTLFTIIFILTYLVFYYSLNHFYRRASTPARPGPNPRPNDNPSTLNGLDPSVIQTFPIIKYSERLRPGTGPLDCPVCLSPFEGDETLRLIPKCDHVFHPHCVDPWLEAHATCPYCRAELAPQPGESSHRAGPVETEVVVEVRWELEEVDGVGGQFGKHWRCNSTGHMANNGDRLTLGLLPDEVGEEDTVMGKLVRTRSCIITLEIG